MRQITRPEASEYPEYSQVYMDLPEEALLRSGSGIQPGGEVVNRRTVRALAYHLAGHELRHLDVIRERYLGMEVQPSTWAAAP